jgi:ferric-dicitrate binding protein FerR (iron transport regulator)
MTNDDLLIQGYLDGRLSAVELTRLNGRLREDAELREELRLVAMHAVAFGDMARSAPGVRSAAPAVTPRRRNLMPWLALAASLVVLAASLSLFLNSRPSPVLTLLESSGTVTWSNGEPIPPGEPLPAGTLETVGEASTALFRFADGTRITLQGGSELSFSEQGQKNLALSRGTLSAEVRPQPAGRPLLIRTPSAVAEVIGTAFDLTTRAEDTLLKVNEGLVKLKRLADGSQIEVPANRSAVASLDTARALDASSTPEPLTRWSFDFTTTTPPRDWPGIARDGSMHASPYVAKKLPDGRIITHHGISIRTAMLPQPQRLLATETSVIRIQLRQKQPGSLQFMLLTHRRDGGFGGNFECKISAAELRPGTDGWCQILLPIHRFERLDPQGRRRPSSAAGKLLTTWIVSSFLENRGLEIRQVELTEKP